MSRIVHPSISELNCLRQPLTVGEQAVLSLFDRKLPLGWEIYVQPHMNGLRPDFVLLHPQVGIGVFEIKDWDLSAMSYHNDKVRKIHGADEGERLTLRATHDGKSFAISNPVRQIRRYKEEIFSLYCPRLQRGAGFSAVTGGLIFTNAHHDSVVELLAPHQSVNERERYSIYSPIVGKEALQDEDLAAIFPEYTRSWSQMMTPETADDLRGWLVEPDFAASQRRPLEMDARQRSFAQSRTESGYRRIRGPAGSGKSLVLAARAAQLAAEGKSVLVVTFNITLWHYLRDLVARSSSKPGWANHVTFVHFHRWCQMVCGEAGLAEEYDDLWKDRDVDTVLNGDLPSLALEAVRMPGITRYDAILVDEGQDYRLSWWNALRYAGKPDAELLLVADATQDVYGTAQAWTEDAMRGAGFAGPWAELETSYRLPNDAMALARSYAEKFLPNETVDLPQPQQGSLEFYPCTLRWVQCESRADSVEAAISQAIIMMRQTGKNGLANADITVLTDDQDAGSRIVFGLDECRVKTVDTFHRERPEAQRKKMAFWMGDARIKATTLHSFKGWEARLLVVHVTRAFSPDALALTYAGLTRLKRDVCGSWLTVICSDPVLAEYGRTWPDHVDRRDPMEGTGDALCQ